MYIIRKAKKKDAHQVYSFIMELAAYQNNVQDVANTIEQLTEDGWGPHPVFETFLVENEQHQFVGMALWFVQYSTWKGKLIYLEDLFVMPAYRGQGIGKMLMNHLIQYARKNGFKGVSWQVLHTNIQALEFYKKIGAHIDKQWANGKIIF